MHHDLDEYADEEGFVPFGPIARARLREQNQYASRYITGRMDGYPALGADLRFKNLDASSYHSIRIHQDDVDSFVERYLKYQADRLAKIINPD